MARWRTLYEVGVVATVIADAGDALAQQYIQHEIVESKLAMDEYDRCRVLWDSNPYLNVTDSVSKSLFSSDEAHGADFGKPTAGLLLT